jgi:hypothetical protein
MTFLIIMLCILGYVGIAIPTSIYTRNRSLNKSFNRWHKQSVETNKHLFYTKKNDEELLLEGMKRAKEYDSADWAVAGFLGGFFWPAFLVGFAWHWLYKKVESKSATLLPKTDIEKKIERIHTARELEKQRQEMINIGRKLNLDVKQLENLGE